MIRPKIPLVANGQRLTSDLINSMIHRTEYAADLLRQYRLTAGTEMYVEPHYDGTRVSYLQPVGGGQILPPLAPTSLKILCGSTTSLEYPQGAAFYYSETDFKLFAPAEYVGGGIFATDVENSSVVGISFNVSESSYNGFIYNINNLSLQILRPTPFKPLPRPTDYYDFSAEGISNEIIVGYYEDWFYGYCGFVYMNGTFLNTQYPNPPGIEPSSYISANETLFNGIHKNIIVGTRGVAGAESGLIFDLSTNSYTVISPPSGYYSLRFFGVYNGIICGSAISASGSKAILYSNNNFAIFEDGYFYKINSKYVTYGNTNKILDYNNGIVEIIQNPSNPANTLGIYGIQKD